ncbi:MAG TPA: DUF1579 domain-containing protein [Thermoanaerobaculia bacterium]
MKAILRSFSVLLLILAASAWAGDEKSAKQQADEKAAMEAWMKAATPGDAHKKLAELEGTFEATVRMWDKPGAEPNVSKGTSENRLILGGRWLEQRFKSTFMDQPFEGVGYTGYDNIKKQYVGTWMDTMSTGVMLSTGQPGKVANSYVFTGTMDDPMSGKSMPVEEKFVVHGPDRHVMEMYAPGPDGKMYKNMEIEYLRKK